MAFLNNLSKGLAIVAHIRKEVKGRVYSNEVLLKEALKRWWEVNEGVLVVKNYKGEIIKDYTKINNQDKQPR